MANVSKILVTANPDLDDCLAGAAEAYIEEHPGLVGWDLAPRWEDESNRRYIELTVPTWHLDEVDAAESAQRHAGLDR